jgi:L-alanine-DL-glutamate epimerase-like enolase superfamily enzyme
MGSRRSDAIPIEKVSTGAYQIPTDGIESDGTYDWNSTTMVTVDIEADGRIGSGYTYADAATAILINDHLTGIVLGRDAMSIRVAWDAMVHSIRNLGRPGICAMAISAVDCALWDLKARLLDLPLVRLIGQVRPAVSIYGSGGFTSYTIERLRDQLRGWVEQGISMLKMKIGRDAQADVDRVRAAREAIGKEARLLVDANGAYSRKQSLTQAQKFAESDVSWFEEPVPSDDLDGLRFVREHAPPSMEVAAGEYGYDLDYFQRMLAHGAVDVLQADVTRCGGFTGFSQVATLCEAHHIPLSAHCAPTLHLPIACATPSLRHLEYFYDHARIEKMFFDGVGEPIEGVLAPDLSRPGVGLDLKRADLERFRI